MIAPLKWIQSYTKIDTTPQEFAHKMTMTGSKVEGYDCEADHISNVVTGKIVTKKRHPDSDHLWVCSVFVGDYIAQIVTGAQNIHEGEVVPVALDGARLPNGKEIHTGELRGVKSDGMMCSLDELGLTGADFPDCEEDGIMVLPFETPVGVDIAGVIGLDDTVFEFEITSNRPDCLCISGLAREAAVTYNADFSFPLPRITKFHGDVSTLLAVENQTPKNCLRYTGAVVENVRVAPSPLWMRERLRRCGVRPINNIVDITNYVMLEYNQPMHAFDHRHVKDGKIIVRQAKNGETVRTLDGVTRRLTSDMTVIADSEKALAIAGVMGGEYTGIEDDTTTIIFESACFNGVNVRTTSKALGLRTEASSRFEKGLDPLATEPAIMRALELIEKLDAGDIVKGVVDAKGHIPGPRSIPLDPERINQFLGATIDTAFMTDTLTRLGCRVDGELNVTPPSFRADLEGFADLAEEVARFYGYDKIPTSVMSGITTARPTARQRFDREMVNLLVASGYYEATTYSFMGQKDLDMICVPEKSPLRTAVTIQNPLGEDTSMMRTTAIPAMMEALARNYKARNPAAGLFELATEYVPGNEALPAENKKIIVGSYSLGFYYSLKGLVEFLARRANISELQFEPLTTHPALHPGRAASVSANGTVFAVIGEALPTVSSNYGIDERVYLADIDLDKLYGLRGPQIRFVPLPRFPAVTRDLALVCDIDVPSVAVERAIREGCGELLESVDVFDVYTGDKVQAGKKSIAYSLVLRDANKTLTDADADGAIQRTLTLLSSIGITLRS